MTTKNKTKNAAREAGQSIGEKQAAQLMTPHLSKPARIFRDKNKLGTVTHPLNYGDAAEIKNTTFGGKIVTEGFAKIIGATDTDDRYLVQFSNGDEVERFVPANGFHVNSSAVPELLELVQDFVRGCERGDQLGEVFFSKLLDKARATITKSDSATLGKALAGADSKIGTYRGVLQKVLNRFRKEFDELTDGGHGKITDFPEVKEAFHLLEE